MIIIHERMPAVETGYLYIQNIIIKWRQAGAVIYKVSVFTACFLHQQFTSVAE